MAFRELNGLSPPYVDQLVRVADLPSRHRLRLFSSHRLHVPGYRRSIATIGRHSFPVAASILWNSLPPDIQSSSSLTDFRQSFPDILKLVIYRLRFRGLCNDTGYFRHVKNSDP